MQTNIQQPKPSGGVKFKTLVLAFSAIASFAPLAFTSFHLIQASSHDFNARAQSDLVASNASGAARAKEWLSSQKASVMASAKDADLRVIKNLAQEPQDASATPLEPLAPVVDPNKFPGYLAWAVSDLDGNTKHGSATGDIPNTAQAEHFKAIVGGAPSHLQMGPIAGTQKTGLLIAVPVVDPASAAPEAVFTAWVDTKPLAPLLAAGKLPHGGMAYIVDAGGQILAHPMEKSIGSKVVPEVAMVLKSSGSGKAQIVDSAGAKMQVVTQDVGAGLRIVSQMNQQSVIDAASEERKKVLFSIAPFAALSLVLSFLAASLLSRKISRLTGLIHNMSNTTDSAEVDDLQEKIRAVGGSKEVRGLAHETGMLAKKYRAIVARPR